MAAPAVPFQKELDHLKDNFRGEILLPGAPRFDSIAGHLFNKIFTSRIPAVILRPVGASDVSKAIQFSKDTNLKLIVRSGGHCANGASAVHGGLLLDLSLMKAITIDREAKTARVETGNTLGDIDMELGYHGFTVPVGTVAFTGIGGLALHGGVGLLTKRYGATVDNIVGVEVVTADGKVVYADEKNHSDLWWACKGAGSNFGVVISLVLKIYPNDTVYGGTIMHVAEKPKEMLKEIARLLTEDDDYGSTCWLIQPPVFPPCGVIIHMWAHFGAKPKPEQVGKTLTDLCPLLPGHADAKYQPFTDVNLSSAPFLAHLPMVRLYMKTLGFSHMSDALIDKLNEAWSDLKKSKFGPLSWTIVEHWGGKMATLPKDTVPCDFRREVFIIAPIIAWQDPALDDEGYKYAQKFASFFDEFTNVFNTGGVYFNYQPDSKAEKIYGAVNVQKLKAIKAQYDPTGFFHGSLTGGQ